ncbi:hypothetical protein [Thalassobacillus pellis]|nr:hypothetical protein [Thalassobacillus pellis]MBM7553717.1 hypothetical protein [Thalassobacillus pellis]
MNFIRRCAFVIILGFALAVVPFQVHSPQVDKQEEREQVPD